MRRTAQAEVRTQVQERNKLKAELGRRSSELAAMTAKYTACEAARKQASEELTAMEAALGGTVQALQAKAADHEELRLQLQAPSNNLH